MYRMFLLAKAKREEMLIRHSGKELKEVLGNDQNNSRLLFRIGKKLKEWYHTSGSRTYLPSLNIDEVD